MDGLKEKLITWAKEYNAPSFIANDPIKFPRKYMDVQVNAEISGLLTALISFGRREQIIKKAEELDNMFKWDPLHWITNCKYLDDIPYNNKSFYRTITNMRMRFWCNVIRGMIMEYGTIENYLLSCNIHGDELHGALSILLGFSLKSANKRIAMFLRWMVRDDGIVDLGLWKGVDKKDLIIPLDIHVHGMALELGITKRKTADIITAREISEYMKNVFPNDPCLGDFALFGYGINRFKLTK